MPDRAFDSLQTFSSDSGPIGQFHSLPQLEKNGVGPVSRLPHSLRVVLESVLRNCDGEKITEDDVRDLANWQPNGKRIEEIPFIVARVLLQDFTGVPLLVDLAAMRSAVARLGKNSGIIEPLVSGRSGDRSLGPGRLLQHARCVRKEHGDGVPAQSLALPVFEVGHTGVRRILRNPAGHRHLSPGQSRISCEERLGEERLLSGLPRRHRFTHDDDQRSRHRWLGRRWNRG